MLCKKALNQQNKWMMQSEYQLKLKENDRRKQVSERKEQYSTLISLQREIEQKEKELRELYKSIQNDEALLRDQTQDLLFAQRKLEIENNSYVEQNSVDKYSMDKCSQVIDIPQNSTVGSSQDEQKLHFERRIILGNVHTRPSCLLPQVRAPVISFPTQSELVSMGKLWKQRTKTLHRCRIGKHLHRSIQPWWSAEVWRKKEE